MQLVIGTYERFLLGYKLPEEEEVSGTTPAAAGAMLLLFLHC